MTSQLRTLEFREIFRRAAAAVKERTFKQLQLEELLMMSTALESSQDRASVLRFALRLATGSGRNHAAIVDALRSAYSEAATEESLSEITREKLWAWWRRYGGGTPQSIRAVQGLRLPFHGTFEQLVENIAEGDWDFFFNRAARVLECWTGKECLLGAVEGIWSPFTGTVLGQVNKGLLAVHSGAWKCAGKTDIGVPNGDHNDDAIAVCASEGAGLLLAVADGTGDSRFGSRASTIALQGLVDARCAGASLEWAIKMAASKLRADNCVNGLDGACTLAACVLHDDHAELVAVGDAFFVCVGPKGQVHTSVFDKERRSVLGGEPLGLTITSSGRLVENLDRRSNIGVIGVDRAHRVLLGTDGACAPGLNESLNELIEILGRSGNPLDVVETLVAGAQDRFRTNGAYDNISAVVASRHV